MIGTAFDIIAHRAALSADAIAMEEAATGLSVSFAQADANAGRDAALLILAGVAPGDRVAVLCRNRIAFFEMLFACAKIGAIMVPLNWRMPLQELIPIMRDCRPVLLAHGREDADIACALADAAQAGENGFASFVRLDFDDPGPQGHAMRRAALAPHPGRGGWPADEPWYLLYTSGTTGTPKAVIYTHAMAWANYVNITQPVGMTSADVTLNFLPLFHTAGINLHTVPALMMGAKALIMPGFDADLFVRLLKERRFTIFFGVPAVYQILSVRSDFEALDLSAVRHWGCGGAPLPDALVRLYERRGAQVCNGMGMTETGPTVFIADPHDALRKIGSVGKPQMLAAVRIVGVDGHDAPLGHEGEFWFKGPGVTPGYWQQPAATAAAFAPDGWLRSGDIGRCDVDGYYYVIGRIKDMFISGGENVYPAEVENILCLHPDILEAAVIGVPDAQWGETGRAYLLVKPGHTAPDASALAAWCRARLAAYKIPKAFVCVADFPRTAAGKVQKGKLGRWPGELL
jgi:fatty-acyl-CoA synthase